MTKTIKILVAGVVTLGTWALALVGNKENAAECIEEDGMDAVEVDEVIEDGDIA